MSINYLPLSRTLTYDSGSVGGAPITRDSEELDDGRASGRDGVLLFKKSVDEEQVASSLKLGVTKAAKGRVGLNVCE